MTCDRTRATIVESRKLSILATVRAEIQVYAYLRRIVFHNAGHTRCELCRRPLLFQSSNLSEPFLHSTLWPESRADNSAILQIGLRVATECSAHVRLYVRARAHTHTHIYIDSAVAFDARIRS
jgi:hypothetical protein